MGWPVLTMHLLRLQIRFRCGCHIPDHPCRWPCFAGSASFEQEGWFPQVHNTSLWLRAGERQDRQGHPGAAESGRGSTTGRLQHRHVRRHRPVLAPGAPLRCAVGGAGRRPHASTVAGATHRGGESRLRPEKSEVQRLISDNGRAKKIIEWEPQVSFRDGLSRTIEWIADHLDLYRPKEYQL